MMKKLLLLIKIQFYIVLTSSCISQTLSTTNISNLCSELKETSGLCFANNEFYTINDSGNGAYIYVIDSITGCWLRKIQVASETNTDWEAITCDTEFLYIGDFGNNAGTRTDLKILKISLDSIALMDTVSAESIYFNYALQTDFSPMSNNTSFDCEAFVSIEDSLYLFSKNWTADSFQIYRVTKTPGLYSLTPIKTIPTLGKITDAHWDGENLRLIGYETIPFCQFYDNLSSIYLIDNVNPINYSINFVGSPQMEAICLVNDLIYITSEELIYSTFTFPSIFGRLTTMNLSTIESNMSKLLLYRLENQLHVSSEKEIKSIEIFDITGSRVSSTTHHSTSFVIEIDIQNGIAVLMTEDGGVFSRRF